MGVFDFKSLFFYL